MTGTVPHRRLQVFFKLEGTVTPEQLEAVNEVLKTSLGGTGDGVQNADRVMRLAGTVSYPPPHKVERGYVPEVTTLHATANPRAYDPDELIGLITSKPEPYLAHNRKDGAARGHRSSSNASGGERKPGRTDAELEALLESSRKSGNWHNAIRNTIATMIGRGWSDSAIRLTCKPYCEDGFGDEDLDDFIDRGRAKWEKPSIELDPHAQGDEHSEQGNEQDDDEPGDGTSEPQQGDERVANEAPVAKELPTIKVSKRLSKMTSHAQQMLINAGVPFYHRGGELVRPIIRTALAAHGQLTRTAQLKPICTAYMRDTMCRHAHWMKYDGRSKGFVPTMVPREVSETLLARDGVWKFREVVGVIACPTMRRDGSLLVKQGYDASTRLLMIEPPAMPPIPDEPTREDALQALALLEELVCESPFEGEAGKSVALSGMITPVVRGAMAVAPMHVASAPMAGTGKSFLWDLVAAIATGQRRIPVIAAGDEEETEKRLGGILLTGQPLISIDNVNGPLKGEFLAQAIEQHFVEVRPLGGSKIVTVEAGGTTIFATGNNISIVGEDLCRRTIMAQLDALMEAPQLRQFRNDPISMILSDRGKYIAACLTICRAYVVAGRPALLPRLASFAEWSDTVRSALVWLGKADPLDTMVTLRDDDPDRELLGELLRAWAQYLGTGFGTAVPLAFIADMAGRMRLASSSGGYDPEFPALHDAVRRATGTVGNVKIDFARFGIWCRSNKARPVGGLRLMNKSSNTTTTKWWIEKR